MKIELCLRFKDTIGRLLIRINLAESSDKPAAHKIKPETNTEYLPQLTGAESLCPEKCWTCKLIVRYEDKLTLVKLWAMNMFTVFQNLILTQFISYNNTGHVKTLALSSVFEATSDQYFSSSLCNLTRHDSSNL